MRGRTTIDLQPFKAQIIAWFQDEHKTLDDIASLLLSIYEITVTAKTVQPRLKDWPKGLELKTLLTYEFELHISFVY